MRKRLIFIGTVGCLSIVLLNVCISKPTAAPCVLSSSGLSVKPRTFDEFEKATVLEVIDGDTIIVEQAGKQITIRYLGIDTPEIMHTFSGKTQPFGQEAKSCNTFLVQGKQVYLEPDARDQDDYHRKLRYVYLEDGTMVNAALLSLGLGKLLIIAPNTAHTAELDAATKEAQLSGTGIWH